MQCIHQGKVVTKSSRGEVYSCDLFGKCTLVELGFKKSGQPLPVCETCPHKTFTKEVLDGETFTPSLPTPSNKSPHDIFERVVVINLKRRPDRLTNFFNEMKKGWPFTFPTVFRAIDGQLCPPPPGYTQGPFAWACFQSHRHVIEQALQDGINSILIMEDDAILLEGFYEKSLQIINEVPQDWDFLWLGGHHMQPPIYISENIVRSTHMDRMHAYALRGRAIADLYKFWHQWHAGHCDWAISQWVANYNSYCAYPFIVGQRGGFSDINFRVHQDNWWHADKAISSPQEPQGSTPTTFILRKESVNPHGKHLIYHIWPKKGNGTWQWNVDHLLKRISLFDGVRSIAIATSEDADSPDEVKEKFKDVRIDNWIIEENHSGLGETHTFPKLIATLPKMGKTFYGHAKSVKYPTPHLREWTSQMYTINLDFPHRAWKALQTQHSAGGFIQDLHGITDIKHRWCYAGTFFWFDNEKVLSHPEVSNLIQNFWGVEAWLGNLFPKETAYNLTPIEHGPIHWPSESAKTGKWIERLSASIIPIYIISRNLVTPLQRMVDYLLQIPEAMPIIIDNASTYPPLLHYYKQICPVRVIRTNTNAGHLGWIPHILNHKELGITKYVVTDPDLILDNIPLDILQVLSQGLDDYPDTKKVGLSLDLDSIPMDYPLATQVKEWESQFWASKIGNFYRAGVDTTFSMRRASDEIDQSTVGHLRADKPYTAVHWPWTWNYVDRLHNPEIRHYINTAETATHWTKQLKTIGLPAPKPIEKKTRSVPLISLEERTKANLEAFPCSLRKEQLRIEERKGSCGVSPSPVFTCLAEENSSKEASLWRFCTSQTMPICNGCSWRKVS